MKLLVLGLSRTGTLSITRALRALGHEHIYHGGTITHGAPAIPRLWTAALRAKFAGVGVPWTSRRQWEILLAGYDAVTDMPGACFAEELVAAYPEAKVVLSVRGVEAWERSMEGTVMWRARDPWFYWLSWVDLGYWAETTFFYTMLDLFFDGDFERHGRRVFEEHNERVRRLVPKGRLLEYNVAEGWGPLCSFLECSVPAEEFPRSNRPCEFINGLREVNGQRCAMFVKKLRCLQIFTVLFLVTFLAMRGLVSTRDYDREV